MNEYIKLTNEKGLAVKLSNFGAAIYDISLLMSDGTTRPLTVHPLDDEAFNHSPGYYGKTIGRNAGRLTNGTFQLNGKEYIVKEAKKNNGLHGGDFGLSYVNFKSVPYSNSNGKGIIFSYLSKHLVDGFPGNLHIFVTYFLFKNENKLEIRYEAKTDADTVCNLTNHVYFNLDGGGSIANHSLMIFANEFVSVDENILPQERQTINSIMDFRVFKKIGTHLNDSSLINISGGYDHPYVFSQVNPKVPQVILKSSSEDLILNIYTSYPTVVFYSGNYPTDEIMNTGKALNKHEALALEPQYLPNAINSPLGQEKTGLYQAGHHYTETITYEFLTK